ncbi:MAG: hypothetical protein OXP73_06025 [Chloroflexota bacterium]|nr:hypothetical protein [Chloroflexota bacterium]
MSRETRAQVVALLSEGIAINAITRVAPVFKPTVLKLLTDLGPVVAAYQGEVLRDLALTRVQVDEIWAYVGMKAKHVPAERRG